MWAKVKNYFKEQSQMEKKKLKEMNFREKREYIWEYYRIHIIAAAIVLFVIGSVINSILNPPTPSYASLAFYDIYLDEESDTALINALTDVLIEDPESLAIYTNYFVSDEDPSVQMAVTQKFVAMIAAQDLDIILAKREDFEGLIPEGFFMDLSEMGFEDELIIKGVIEENGEEAPYGVSLKDSVFLKDLGFNPETLCIGLVINTNRANEAEQILRLLMQ